jgi:hypothetical protein
MRAADSERWFRRIIIIKVDELSVRSEFNLCVQLKEALARSLGGPERRDGSQLNYLTIVFIATKQERARRGDKRRRSCPALLSICLFWFSSVGRLVVCVLPLGVR